MEQSDRKHRRQRSYCFPSTTNPEHLWVLVHLSQSHSRALQIHKSWAVSQKKGILCTEYKSVLVFMSIIHKRILGPSRTRFAQFLTIGLFSLVLTEKKILMTASSETAEWCKLPCWWLRLLPNSFDHCLKLRGSVIWMGIEEAIINTVILKKGYPIKNPKLAQLSKKKKKPPWRHHHSHSVLTFNEKASCITPSPTSCWHRDIIGRKPAEASLLCLPLRPSQHSPDTEGKDVLVNHINYFCK